MSDMISRMAQPGRIDWIGLRSSKGAAIQAVTAALVRDSGLVGDRARGGKRAVTLLQAEHLVAIGGFLGRGPVRAEALRRNLVISGLNLAGAKGRRLWLGEAELEITGICAPCSKMEQAFGHGGYAAVRGHGGWCAQVIRSGRLELGDKVQIID